MCVPLAAGCPTRAHWCRWLEYITCTADIVICRCWCQFRVWSWFHSPISMSQALRLRWGHREETQTLQATTQQSERPHYGAHCAANCCMCLWSVIRALLEIWSSGVFCRWAVLEHMRHPPAGFEQVVATHFKLKRRELEAQCEIWQQEAMLNGHNNRSNDAFNQVASSARSLAVVVSELRQQLQQLAANQRPRKRHQAHAVQVHDLLVMEFWLSFVADWLKNYFQRSGHLPIARALLVLSIYDVRCEGDCIQGYKKIHYGFIHAQAGGKWRK